MKSVQRCLLAGILLACPAFSQAPVVAGGGVVNAADYTANAAAGAIVSVFGERLATGVTSATEAPLPAQLDGTSVEIIDGERVAAAPLFFVSPNQINTQLPLDVAGSSVGVRVKTAAGTSNIVTLALAGAAPRLFTKTRDGRGEAIALHADYTVIGGDLPARPGEVIILYLTGLGAVNPLVPGGVPAGDGSPGNPINVCTATVTVQVNGQPATVWWAGLAPYFVGLYQINVELPRQLPPGPQAIVVTAGGASSQTSVTIEILDPAVTPEGAVRTALEAQARGDTQAMAALFDVEGYSQEAQAEALEVLEVVRKAVTFADFRYEHLATVATETGADAIVRAVISYTMTTKEGSFARKHGLLGFVRKRNAAWRIAALVPDELLNQQFYEEQRPGNPAAARHAAGDLLTLPQLNELINSAMKGTYVNSTKLHLDTMFGAAGRLPGVGDTMANIYQVGDCLYTGGELLQGLWKNGFTGRTMLKAQQIGVGILQIVTEPVPGLDTQADLLAGSLEQLVYNTEISEDLFEVNRYIRNLSAASTQIEVRLFDVQPYQYPEGIEFVRDEALPHGYRAPLKEIRVTRSTAFEKALPLWVVGEIPVDSGSPAAFIIKKLGVAERNGLLYIPVAVGNLVGEDGSLGDAILDGFSRYRTTEDTGLLTYWHPTCRRGEQELAVKLRSGVRSVPVKVKATLMNGVNDLQIAGAPETGVQLLLGASLGGLRVIGKSSLLEEKLWPDLTPYGECLDMAVMDTSIATLSRGRSVTLTGAGAGSTEWRLLLAGSNGAAGVAEIQKDIPVTVSDSLLPMLQHTTFVLGNLGGLHQCEDSKLGPSPIAFGPMSNAVRTTDGSTSNFPVAWTGGAFSVDGTVKDANDNEYKLKIQGQMDPAGRTLLFAQFELAWSLDLWTERKQRHNRTTRFTVTNLPLAYNNKALTNFEFSVEGAGAASAVSGLYYLYRYETAAEVTTCTYSSSTWGLNPHATVGFERR